MGNSGKKGMGGEMINEKDRIEAAIRHLQTAADVDQWAMELAVKALEAQLQTDGDLPSVQPEKAQLKAQLSQEDATDATEDATFDCISRAAAIEAMGKIHIVFRELGLCCAYDMPSFWYNDKKDYKVIQTKYHKGYMQALKDAEGKIKAILEELCYE